MKKISVIIVSLMLLAGSVAMVSCGGVSSEMKKVVEEMNKNLPADIGPGTRLEKMDISGKTLKITTTYTSWTKEEAKEQMQMDEATLKSTMATSLKADPKVKLYADNNITVAYLFKDKNGDTVYNIEMKPSDYK